MNRKTFLTGFVALFASILTWAADTGSVNVASYQKNIRLACIGDSITYGSGIKNRDKDSYPAQLAAMLGEKWEVRNFGVSGATLLKKGDKPYDKQKACTEALAWKPDVIVVKLGTNDTKPQNWAHREDFAADAKALAAAFREANPKMRVFLCFPVPAFPGNFGIRDEIIKNEINPLIQQAAKETDATVIDLYSALSGHADLFHDKVHPNEEGARLIAAAVFHSLTGKNAPAEAVTGAK